MEHLVAVVHADRGARAPSTSTAARISARRSARTRTSRWRTFDIGAFAKGTPSDLNTNVKVEATVDNTHGTAVAGTFTVDNKPGSVVGAGGCPAAQLGGTFTQSSVDAHARIEEPGAPTTLAIKVVPKPGQTKPSLATFDVKTSVGNLAAVRRVPRPRHRLGARACGGIGGHRLEDDGRDRRGRRAEPRRRERRGPRSGHVSVNAKAKGAFTSPQVQAQVRAETLGASGYAFDRGGRSDVGGGLDSAHVSAEVDGGQGREDPAAHTVKLGRRRRLQEGDRGAEHQARSVPCVADGTDGDGPEQDRERPHRRRQHRRGRLPHGGPGQAARRRGAHARQEPRGEAARGFRST